MIFPPPNRKMDSTIFHILLFLFFMLPKTISSNSCATTSCSQYAYQGVPVKYPFKLETSSPHKHCNDYINLKCGDQDKTIIDLLSSGEFEVSNILYSEQTIALSDPENCLARRLMNLSSVYPLRALFYRNYTFYTCPRKLLDYHFRSIECLSNPTNATIAVSEYSSEYMEHVFECKIIVRSMVPTSSSTEDDYSTIFLDLILTWDVSGCKECEGDSQSTRSKILKSPAFIPSTVVLVTLFALACFLSLMKILPASRHNNDNATPNNPSNVDATMPQSTTIMPQQTTQEALPEATTGTLDQNSKIYMQYKELLVLNDDGQGTSLPTGVNSCSICLDVYDEKKDRIRYLPQCKHYFHGACIDHWLKKNTTCPVCRTYISKINRRVNFT